MKKVLFSLLLLASFQGFTQKRNCATMEVNAKNQALLKKLEAGQRTIKKSAIRPRTLGQRLTTVYNIPIVVHVIHNGEAVGTGKNISAAQIQSQINVLNEDFRNTNPDRNNIPAVFQSLQADVQLNFCLAAVDKNGNAMAEPGIDRIDRNLMGFDEPPYDYEYIEENIKQATIWNPSNYLNIWVTDLSDDILGYSQFPDNKANLGGIDAVGGLAATDGIVIKFNAFGRTGNVSAPYNRGRTLTHEMGHFFGLRHLWGDENCGNDFVNDTPTQETENSGCPTFPHVSCSNGPNGDMFMNFMDYVNDNCMHFFTLEQKDRIQAVMAANTPRRSSLGNSTVCNSVAVPVADFTFSPINIVAGSTVTFTDNSSGNPSSWLWNFGGGANVATSTDRNPSVRFNNAGSFQVSLTATNGNGSHTVKKTVIVTAFECIDTLINFSGDPVLYTVKAPGKGYVSGHNSYFDKAKAEKFTYSGPPIKLSQLFYFFGVAQGTGKVNLNVWSADANGKPGTVIFTKEVLISSLKTQGDPTVVVLPNNVTVSGDFFVGFPLTYADGDSVALLTNEEAPVNTAWEQWDDGEWYEYPEGWDLSLNHLVLVEFDNKTQPVASSSNAICGSADVTDAVTFTDASCGVIAKVEPSGASAVSGSANTCVRINATTPFYNNQPYVQRYFDITPSTNAATGTATITLYFRDEDFVNYNANRGGYPPLPTLAGGGSTDPARNNLFITQQHGTSPSGLPGTYSGSTVVINPDDNNIVWNAGLNAWQITFNVTGFSGFFVHTGATALPITMEYFKGQKQGTINTLTWKSNCLSTSVKFEIERSDNGRTYATIGNIHATQARCALPFDFSDNHPLPGVNYYRLKMTEVDGNITYSRVITLYSKSGGVEIVSLLPTLVTKGNAVLNISSFKETRLDLMITDVQGRQIQKVTTTLQAGLNNINLDLDDLATGIYNISGQTTEGKTRTVRFVKQ